MQASIDDMGHLGIDRSTDLLKDQFYWTNMFSDKEAHIKNCDQCLSFKAEQPKAELCPILAIHPMEMIHTDYLTIESHKTDKDINILVITEHFTCYAQAFVTPTQTARLVSQTLWGKFFMHYGLPEKILNINLESSLIAELCELSKIKKLCTCPYRPQRNGQCEQFSSTLISMIQRLQNEAKTNWQEHVSTLVHAYNCTHLTATGFSPYFLVYWETPKSSYRYPVQHQNSGYLSIYYSLICK